MESTETSQDFECAELVANVRDCVELSAATENSFKKLPKSPSFEIELIRQQLKDNSDSEDLEEAIEQHIASIETHQKNLTAEIKSRKALIENLKAAQKFYDAQFGDFKIVKKAYTIFGNRIKDVKEKLEEITPTLPSPIPSPDINGPSPEPDVDLKLPDDQSSISFNLFNKSMNRYTSYLDGKLPFDINDFTSEKSDNNSSSQPIKEIRSRIDDASFNSSLDYYKPEPTIGSGGYGDKSSGVIPGLEPMPVPPVQSEYSSLDNYKPEPTLGTWGYGYNSSGVIPGLNPMLGDTPAQSGYASLARSAILNYYKSHYTNIASDYVSLAGCYSSGNNNSPYMNASPSTASSNMQPVMLPPPPPPPPPSSTPPGLHVHASATDEDFNSTWGTNMTWTPLNDTPASPPYFDRGSSVSAIAPVEYSEHVNNFLAAQDVDDRQLYAGMKFNQTNKLLGLSEEKPRQLDIDRRNLISWTDSPGNNNNNDDDMLKLKSDQIVSPSSVKKSSPKSNMNSTSESQRNDYGLARYSPTDMVMDMEISDEDLDDKDVKAQEQKKQKVVKVTQSEVAALLQANDITSSEDEEGGASGIDLNNGANISRQPFLATPQDHVPQNAWRDASPPINNPQYSPIDVQQQQQHFRNQMQGPWNGSGGGKVVMPATGTVPPPPRPLFPMFSQYMNYNNNNNYDYGLPTNWGAPRGGGGMGMSPMRGGGNGSGGVGWSPIQQPNQYPRGFPRHRGYPFYRGGNGGGRGGFRGKFRGNPWT